MPALKTQNAIHTAFTLKADLADFVTGVARRAPVELDERARKALADVRRDGFAVVEDFWPQDKALAMRDKLEAYLEGGESKDFPEGAWLRVWDNRAYDEGVRRLYHIERLVPELTELRNDPLTMAVAKAYYRRPFYSGALVFQHNTKSNSNTREYHVDAFEREFKAFVYLDDVDEGNGPFTYVRGTHRSHLTRLRKQLAGNGDQSPTSFFDADLGDLKEREVMITGKAGTLILADVRGFHRGSPQVDRSRSVLVNYMFREPGDRELDR
jgi:Phytanoyl-CoA dioxygenase (PhyH)